MIEIDNHDEEDEFKDLPDEENEENEEIEIKEENDDEEIKLLEEKINSLTNQIREIKFPRSESKTDFASGIINTEETKKISNLDEEEIYDLIEKRKFYNFLRYFNWDGLAFRVIKNVRDVEDYSLSKKAKLLDSVFIEKTRAESKNLQEERRSKKWDYSEKKE